LLVYIYILWKKTNLLVAYLGNKFNVEDEPRCLLSFTSSFS